MSGSYVAVAVGANALTGGAITNALGFGPESISAKDAQKMADPFASYRPQLGKMYMDALQPGGTTDITKMPGYDQFKTGVMDPALEASKRSAAASGMMRSGNEQIALEKTDQQGYYGFMTDYLNRLAQGSGATQNPATAAGYALNQGNLNNQGVMQGFAGTAMALGGLYGRSGSGGSTGAMSPDNMSYYNTMATGYGNTGEYGLVW